MPIMKKRKTRLAHRQIANNLMYYIIHNIDTNINMDEMAKEFNVSKFHLHRIFKEQLHANIYETIKAVRLQKAANLLIANKGYTITEIGNMSGYSILTSFIRAFKVRFNQTPKQWRNGGHNAYFKTIVNQYNIPFLSTSDFIHLKPRIATIEDREVHYIRYRGYDNNMLERQKLMVWVELNSIQSYNQIEVYYDNPTTTPLDKCFFVSCIEVLGSQIPTVSDLPKSHIRGGSYAIFSLEGDYDDILRLIPWAYHHWLPNSGFSTMTASSYCIFETKHSSSQKRFKCLYHLPIGIPLAL